MVVILDMVLCFGLDAVAGGVGSGTGAPGGREKSLEHLRLGGLLSL